ncbi:hypothetical protein V5O48_003601 [Marasmius crinis-equi]|uniref:Uncharacterized protein n=1 Tax=Marasmius crinis-equi TaxID=585013 RepID=A0ABR3FSD9_9AGAR
MRGFDPTTTDFARHCGCYDLVFDPVYETSSRFQELVIADRLEHTDSIVTEPQAKEDLESVYTSLLLLFDDVPLDGTGTETPEPASSSYGLWSRLASPFTWIAPKDLDIPVMVF